MLKELLTKLTAMIQGTTSDATRDLLENLQKSLLADVTELYRPETILGWYRKLVGKKYDRHGGQKPAPALISQEYRDMILRMARSFSHS